MSDENTAPAPEPKQGSEEPIPAVYSECAVKKAEYQRKEGASR